MELRNSILFSAVFVGFILPIFLLFRRFLIRKKLASFHKMQNDCILISIFHPYCNSFGGGERVLWTGVDTLLRECENLIIFIYTNDLDCLSSPQTVFSRVQTIFDRNVFDVERVRFVSLYSECLLRPSLYPCFTLAGQALGSIVAALEAIIRLPSDVFIDTTGFAFTMPVFTWLIGAKCGAYVHFPTVSSDMEARLASQSTTTPYNNSESIRQSRMLTNVKMVYYALFKILYGWAGNEFNCKLAAVNSSWTQRHISRLWGSPSLLLYPPCPRLALGDAREGTREPWIISIGQFRPEKNHELQLKSFALFLKGLQNESSKYRLILIGGCRDYEDFTRVQSLKETRSNLGIPESQVTFEVNASSTTVKMYLTNATINVHTMLDEHFGIGIVEGMAAGLVTIANRSGGPLTDIIGPADVSSKNRTTTTPVGFLASTEQEYADIFRYVLVDAPGNEMVKLRAAAERHARTLFSEEIFASGWLDFVERLCA